MFIKVTSKLTALKGLDARLREIHSYLEFVIDGKLPLNHEILYHLQVHNENLVFLVERCYKFVIICTWEEASKFLMCMQLFIMGIEHICCWKLKKKKKINILYTSKRDNFFTFKTFWNILYVHGMLYKKKMSNVLTKLVWKMPNEPSFLNPN